MTALPKALESSSGRIRQILVPDHRGDRLLIKKLPGSLFDEIAEFPQCNYQNFGASGGRHGRVAGMAEPLQDGVIACFLQE